MSANALQKKLGEEIKQMEQAQFGNPDDTVTKEPEDSTEAQPEVQKDPATEPEVKGTEGSANAITTEMSPETSEDAHRPAEQDKTDWKKRYVNYKASADSTIHQSRQEIIRLTESNLKLTERVDDLSKQVANLGNKDVSLKDLLSQEERDIVGDETLSSVEKLTKAALDAKLKPLEDELALEKARRLDAAKAALEDQRNSQDLSFVQKLGNLVPDFREIDSNPGFLNWMEEVDPDSGMTKKYIFKQAQSLGDVGRVASFFKKFKEITSKPNETLEAKITPEASAVAAPQPTATPEKPVWTMAGIESFYNDCIRGVFKGTNKERSAIEAEIDQAIQSGSVR